MVMELLFEIIAFLFWPILIIGLIAFWIRRRRTGRFEQFEQVLSELSDLLQQVLQRIREVEDRVTRLEQAGVAPALPLAAAPTPAAVHEVPAAPAVAAEAEAPAVLPAEAAPVAEAPAVAEAPSPVEEALSALQRRRRELEQRFIENWTGILGAVVVVAGVTFVGIYTALQLAPFYRFLLTLAVAVALVGGSFVLARKEAWRTFAGWLRSAGAAIALFACAAAGGLPGLGLQWITDPLPALLLLVVGIAANLLIAWVCGAQAMATLHVVLSLVPLLIVPASTTSLAIASAVTLYGVVLAARGRWDRHLAVVLVACALFHAFWYARMGAALGEDIARYLAAGCAALVFATAALVHYRKDYAQPDAPPPLQVGVHLAGWLLLALALFVYLPSSLVRGVVLLACGVLAYRFAQRARALRITWLRRADTLAAQAFVLLALLSGHDLGATASLLMLFVLAETLGFRWLVPRGEDAFLDRIANVMPTVAAALLALAGLGDLGLPTDRRLGVAAVLIAGAVLSVLGQRVLRTPGEDTLDVRPVRDIDHWLAVPGTGLGVAAGALVLLALVAVAERWWLEAAALVTVGGLLVAWSRLHWAGQRSGATLAVAGAHLLSWFGLLSGLDWAPGPLTVHVAPLAALAAGTLWISREARLRTLAIALLGIDLGLAAFLYFDPLSPLIPGVAWLVLSLVALEAANRLAGRDSVTVLLLGYGYLLAFAGAYALVIVQAPGYVGPVSARLLIELFALGVFAYWWVFRPREALADGRAWIAVHPLFVEVLLAGVAITVVVEVAAHWWAVAWAVLALVLLSPPAERLLDARARLYSLLFYWVSVVDMAVVMSALEVPSPNWFEQPEFTSLVAIALQVAYVAWAHRRLVLAGVVTPAPLQALGQLGELVGARRNLYVYYPLFAGVALFLYWRFDHSVLTLLWATEAFVVFVLSAWLRENQFRYVALAGLAACLARLVLIDMAEANLALRGVVFIGVGSLMLGMNAIYNRYRARFEA
jgi:hypothetical protein